jgi:hypothetical protein
VRGLIDVRNRVRYVGQNGCLAHFCVAVKILEACVERVRMIIATRREANEGDGLINGTKKRKDRSKRESPER